MPLTRRALQCLQAGWTGAIWGKGAVSLPWPARCTAALVVTLSGYEMSCWTGLAEPSWALRGSAGTVPVACDVRGDIARRGCLLLFSSTC